MIGMCNTLSGLLVEFAVLCSIILDAQTYVDDIFIDNVVDGWYGQTMCGLTMPGCVNISRNTPFHGPFGGSAQIFYQIFQCIERSHVTLYYSEGYGCGTNEVDRDYIQLSVNGEVITRNSRLSIEEETGTYKCGINYQSKCGHNKFSVHNRIIPLGIYSPNDLIKVEFETDTNQIDEQLIVALIRLECGVITESPSISPTKPETTSPSVMPTNTPTIYPINTRIQPTFGPSEQPTTNINNGNSGEFLSNKWVIIGIISITITSILCCVTLFCLYMVTKSKIDNDISENGSDNSVNKLVLSTVQSRPEGMPKSNVVPEGIYLEPDSHLISMDSDDLYEMKYDNTEKQKSIDTATKNCI